MTVSNAKIRDWFECHGALPHCEEDFFVLFARKDILFARCLACENVYFMSVPAVHVSFVREH